MACTLLNLACSPCPNDTFIFYWLAHRPDVKIHLHDVEQLNRFAFQERFEVSKLSFHAWLMLRDRYTLLCAGAVLGRGCGPLVITRVGEILKDEAVVALPGEHTTAHLLFRLCFPQIKRRVFMPFNKIMDVLAEGRIDAGVIIHEGRFVFAGRGFRCAQDLGAWWEEQTGLPLPLGCMAAHRKLGKKRIACIERRLEDSIAFALDQPDATRNYVRAHAQEMADDVTSEHIKTYVSHFTRDLGAEGRAAVAALECRARTAGIIV